MIKQPTRPILYRIARIHRIILAAKYPTVGSLASEMEVSARTVMRDLEYMRDMFGAPISFDRGKHGFCYSEPGYDLPNIKISEGELLSLLIASRAFKQYEGTHHEADLRRAFGKIQVLLPSHVSLHISELAASMSFANTAPRRIDSVRYKQILRAVREHQQIRVKSACNIKAFPAPSLPSVCSIHIIWPVWTGRGI